MNPEQTPYLNSLQRKEESFLFRVTPFSKYLAMFFFIFLPFLGGWIGYMYAPEKVVVIEKPILDEENNIKNRANDTVRYTMVDEGFLIEVPSYVKQSPAHSGSEVLVLYDERDDTQALPILKVYEQTANAVTFSEYVERQVSEFETTYPELIGKGVSFAEYEQTKSKSVAYTFETFEIGRYQVLRHKRNIYGIVGDINDMYVWKGDGTVLHFSSEQNVDEIYLSLQKVAPPKLEALLQEGMKIGGMTLVEYGPYQANYSELDYGNVRMLLQGAIEVTGTFEYEESEIGFEGYCMSDFSEETLRVLPYVFGNEPAPWFCFRNEGEVFEKLGDEKKRVTVLIDNYELKVYPSEVVDRADFISLVR